MKLPELNSLEPLALLAALAVFGLVLAVWAMVTVLWARRRIVRDEAIRSRLADDADLRAGERTLRLWREGEETTLIVPDLKRVSLLESLERLRVDCGWKASLGSLLGGLAAVVLGVALVLYLLTGSAVTGFAGAGVIVTFAWWYATRRRSRQAASFERQLVDGLELAARALRAGQPLLGSFQLIAKEIPAPVGKLFAEICQQQAMGISLDDAVRRAAHVSNNSDMKLFSASLAIHVHSGGNLANVVQGIAIVIRERMRLSRRFRILTAQTQMSKRVLIGMPIVMFGLLQLVNGEYMRILFVTPMGQLLLFVAATGLLMGWFVMNKMASLHA